MNRALREGVQASILPDGIELTDTQTGFAVELRSGDVPAMTSPGPDGDRLWSKLSLMGLAKPAADLKEVRRRQRGALRRSEPPLLDRLRDLMARIRREIPFFCERAASYDPRRLASLEDFQGLPYLRKQDLRANFPNGLIPTSTDLRAGLDDGSLTILATSGSTDERLQIVTRSIIDRLPFGSDDLFGVPIGGKQPRTAFFTTPVCASMVCRRAAGTFEERRSSISPDLYLRTTNDPFAIETPILKSFCEDVERFQPSILAADPLYLQCVVRAAKRDGIKLPTIPVIQRGFEFATRKAIADIREAFAAPVFNDYGASEENRIAIECHLGSLHVRADVVYFEIIDQSGPCQPGIPGAVAITTFDTVTPLVRYLIGDVAAWTGRTCSCAFSDWPTIDYHGRSKDLVRSRGRWVTAAEIDDAVGTPDWLDFYRLSQTSSASFEIEVVPAAGESPEVGELSTRLKHLIEPDKVRYRPVSRIDPLPSMKIGTVQTRLPTCEIP
ncbi:phenylacetate--CoA ligase family protein [Mesorhizobium temperatum]|nr:hypothetical protein [Mesorhizobium temperatum]